jgi:hypothetical protein
MNTSPNAWLWSEIEKRLGKEQTDALYQEWLAEMRKYNRAKKQSKLAPDAPRQPHGRHARKAT